MPHQNRVNPFGDIVARPERGIFTGNRGGVLHSDSGEIVTPYTNKSWIICELEYKERQAQIMAPGHYTHLFFLDEATALAAGHRPCFECRRERATVFRDCWLRSIGRDPKDPPSISELDDLLHNERYTEEYYKRDRQKRTYNEAYATLPDGAFVLVDRMPHLIWHRALYLWTPAGYCAPVPFPRNGEATVLTPRASVGALRMGYGVGVHRSVDEIGAN